MSKTRLLLIALSLISFILSFMPAVIAAEPKANKTTDKNEIEFKLRKEEVTFIPYRELDKLLQTNKKLVFMSYQELKDLINKKSQIRPLAPVSYVIKDLALTGIASNDTVSFDAVYKIQILNKEWVYVPILSTQVGLKSAEFDGKSAPISTDGSNFRILSSAVGEHTLKMKFDVKLDEAGNTKSFKFDMPTLPITRLAINVPEVPIKLNIQNASGQRAEVKAGHTVTYANLIGQGSVAVDWKSNLVKLPKQALQKIAAKEDKRPSKVIVEVQTLISVDEGIMQGYSTYYCQIYHKPVEKLTLNIPDDIEIISVTSPNDIVRKGPPQISDPNGSKPGKLLTVYFNSQIKDNATFNIAFDKTFENKKIAVTVPDIHLVGPEINKVDGYIAIQSLGNLEIQQLTIKNISPIDISNLPYQLESIAEHPILLSYSFIKDFYNLDLEVIPHKDAPVQVAMIDKVQIDSRLASNGILTTKVDYTIRNMSEQYIEFYLPANAEVLTGVINGQTVQVEKENDEVEKRPKYFINIKNYQDERPFSLSVMYRQDYGFNILSHILDIYKLSAPKVRNIPALTLSWILYVPDDMKYWYKTNLDRGYTDYASYISSQTASNDYNEQSTSTINAQVAGNIAMPTSSEVGLENDKVTGVLPPEFSMPPTRGLTSFNFSDYLLKPDAPSIVVFAATKLISLIIFIAMLYIGWLIACKVHCNIKESETALDRAKYILPIAVILFFAGYILGQMLIWLPVFLAAAVYIAFGIYKNTLNYSKTKS